MIDRPSNAMKNSYTQLYEIQPNIECKLHADNLIRTALFDLLSIAHTVSLRFNR